MTRGQGIHIFDLVVVDLIAVAAVQEYRIGECACLLAVPVSLALVTL